MLVEVCANSLESALNAQKAGADRIELCSELGVGGLTPSFGLITSVKKHLKIPVHVLIRPRSGHFSYSATEFEVMKADIKACKKAGVDGIVSGVLKKDFTIDLERTKELVVLTGDLHFTFHRAFDWVANPLEALKELANIGVDTVLTSGGEVSAEQGIGKLKAWQKQTSLTLMAGGGISPKNANGFKEVGLTAIHCSGTVFGGNIALSGKISMNSAKHLAEDQFAVTDIETIRKVIKAVK